MKYNSIAQVGPPRSGSTLIYNIFRNIFKDMNVKKTHLPFYDSFNKLFGGLEEPVLYAVSIRHPYNCILSLMDFRELTLESAIKSYMRYGGERLIPFFDRFGGNHDNLILFYYEDFFNNTEGIFDAIESKLDMKIDSDIKYNIIEEWGIESVIEKVNNFGDEHIHVGKGRDGDSFQYIWDSETHLNPNHISQRKGNTHFTELLTDGEIDKIKKEGKINDIVNYFYPLPSPEHPYGWNGDERNKKRSF
jgi:hypothetical protein